MYIAKGNRVIGFVGVQDQVRDATAHALQELDNMSPRIRKVMLTGDTEHSARPDAYCNDCLDQFNRNQSFQNSPEAAHKSANY